MGTTRERELVNLFEDNGFIAMRAAASGSATSSPLPDVLASNARRCVAIEEKYRTTSTNCYIDGDEVEKLREFADGFGADPYLAVRYSTRLEGVSIADWFVVEPSDARRTEGGNYVLHHDEVKDARIFADLLAEWVS